MTYLRGEEDFIFVCMIPPKLNDHHSLCFFQGEQSPFPQAYVFFFYSSQIQEKKNDSFHPNVPEIWDY